MLHWINLVYAEKNRINQGHLCEWSADIWCLVSFESFILITEPTKSNQKGQKTRLCFVHLFTKSRSGRNSKYDICINLSGCLHHHSCFCSFCLCENLPQHTEWERCQSCLPACPLPSSRLLAWLLSAPHPAERGNEWSHTDKHKHLLYVSTNNKCIVMWPSKKKDLIWHCDFKTFKTSLQNIFWSNSFNLAKIEQLK